MLRHRVLDDRRRLWRSGRSPSLFSGRSCAATSSPRSTPARSRCTSGARSGLRIEETEESGSRRSRSSSGRRSPRKTWSSSSRRSASRPTGRPPTRPNAGPMDAVIKVQLNRAIGRSRPRNTCTSSGPRFANDDRFSDLEFRLRRRRHGPSAMNEGKSTPISIRVTGKNQRTAHKIASDQERGASRSTASSTPGSSSDWIIPSTSSTSIGPRRPTWG